MNNEKLLPCPFTGEKPKFFIYKVEDDKYEGKIAVDSIDLEIFYVSRNKEEVKEKLLNIWNSRVYTKEEIGKYLDSMLTIKCECGEPVQPNKKSCPKCGKNYGDHE